MSDKNKKTPLEEAKLGYEEIQRFAEEQAASQLKEQVAEKLKQIFEDKLNEDITININGEDVEVEKDGEVIGSTLDTQLGAEKMGLNIDGETPEEEEEFYISEDEDVIHLSEEKFDFEENGVKYGQDYLPKNPSEINLETEEYMEDNDMKLEQDAAPVAAAPTPVVAPESAEPAATPAPEGAEPTEGSPVAPTEENPMVPELLSKIDTLINVLLQQNGGATPDAEEDFIEIDDEAGTPAPEAAPAPAPEAMEEIEIINYEDKDKDNFIDTMEEQMLEIVEEDEPTIDEMRGLGFVAKRTGDRNLKIGAMENEKGHHAPVTSLRESSKNKAHNESKVDELIKENSSLKSAVKGLQKDRKEFEEAFVELRTQFNEMQLFNGKLALVNKVLMNGGLTTEEKVRICEQFDSVQTYEEASKLFKNIIKENNIKVAGGNDTSKLKGASTNTAKPKSTSEPLYESDEARRAKRLAGITRTEDEN